jgi:hypothetical protein
MANQLYAVPIIIEAFQTGKDALRADQEIPFAPVGGAKSK